MGRKQYTQKADREVPSQWGANSTPRKPIGRSLANGEQTVHPESDREIPSQWGANSTPRKPIGRSLANGVQTVHPESRSGGP